MVIPVMDSDQFSHLTGLSMINYQSNAIFCHANAVVMVLHLKRDKT